MPRLYNFEYGVMEHAIGLSVYPRLVGRYHTFNAYRNYYTSGEQSIEWEEYVKVGYAIERFYKEMGYCYFVTKKGIKYLEDKYGIRIKQEKEDIVMELEND